MALRWIEKAREYIGTKEIHGSKHNPKILELWQAAHLGFKDDETPWCAGFLGGVLEMVGIKSTRSGMARSYLNWGKKLDQPIIGCVVVLARGKAPSGHVGFVTGITGDKLKVLGGNQSDSVSEQPFPRSQVLGYRWPPGEPIPGKKPIVKSKIATGAATGGVIAGADAVAEVADTLEKLQPAKDAADNLGITDMVISSLTAVAGNPKFWMALVVVVICGAIWYWRRRDH